MLRHLLIAVAIGIPAMSIAQVSATPAGVEFRTGMYGLKISPNGQWVGSMAGDASLYDIQNDKYYDCWGSFLGLGNCVANNGMAVGNAADHGVVLLNGKLIYPETLTKYWFCDINGITPDASRLTGIINYPNGGETMYAPFICDIDADGNVGEPVLLPMPLTDFFGMAPQYSSAVWISDDGKTVIGQMVDWRGEYSVPVTYTEDSNGEWSYRLPSKPLFNPTNIEIPENPFQYQPNPPEPVDFMQPVARAAYEATYEAWVESGYNPSLYPDPVNYMTPDEIDAYNEAAQAYNDEWVDNKEIQQKMMEYLAVYYSILKSSPSFSQNELTIHPDGSYMMIHGSVMIDEENSRPAIYKFSTTNDDYEVYNLPRANPYPSQILSDGTLVAVTRLQQDPTAFIVNPGSTEFIPFTEYIAKDYPEQAEWIETNFMGDSGLVSLSDDKKTALGCGLVMQLANFTGDESFYYWTYIWNSDSEILGVEELMAQPTDGIYKVYNLNGVKVLETKDASQLNSLSKGLYIINGKKILK